MAEGVSTAKRFEPELVLINEAPLNIAQRYLQDVMTISGLAAGLVWRMPGRFHLANLLGPSYTLRCVVFHDVAWQESPFTRGMGVNISPGCLTTALRFISKHYNPVGMEDLLGGTAPHGLPPRPVLVTFDDGYSSAAEIAAPLCLKLRVPAVFFLNAAFVDNHRLAPDNLVCYVANVAGMEPINAAAKSAMGPNAPALQSMSNVFERLFPSMSLSERQRFLEALIRLAGIDERQLADDARLYVTGEQIGALAARGFEIGNHTYTHVRCRSLSAQTFAHEIDRNQAELEGLSGKKVRSFSVPYGSPGDLSGDLIGHLHNGGHRAIFLSQSVANRHITNPFLLDRVSPRADDEGAFFSEVEVMPRLRMIRNGVLRRRRSSLRASHQAVAVH